MPRLYLIFALVLSYLCVVHAAINASPFISATLNNFATVARRLPNATMEGVSQCAQGFVRSTPFILIGGSMETYRMVKGQSNVGLKEIVPLVIKNGLKYGKMSATSKVEMQED